MERREIRPHFSCAGGVLEYLSFAGSFGFNRNNRIIVYVYMFAI